MLKATVTVILSVAVHVTHVSHVKRMRKKSSFACEFLGHFK